MNRVLLTVMAFAIAHGSALAQDAVTFTPAASGLKIGDRVRVVLDAPCPPGQPAPCAGELVNGKVAGLADGVMTVDDGGRRRELAGGDVRRVERPADRWWDGPLIGFGLGFGIGFLGVLADDCSAEQWCIFGGPGFAAAVGMLTGGIGAGIGAGLDLAFRHRRVIFERQRVPVPRTRVMPFANRAGAGVKVTVAF